MSNKKKKKVSFYVEKQSSAAASSWMVSKDLMSWQRREVNKHTIKSVTKQSRHPVVHIVILWVCIYVPNNNFLSTLHVICVCLQSPIDTVW